MGTEVLRPQYFLYERYRLSPPAFPRRKTTSTNANSNNSGYRKSVLRSDHKKKPPQQKPEQQQHHLPRRSSSASPPPPPLWDQPQLHRLIPRRSSSHDELQSINRVTILRRGQSLDTIDASRMKRDMNTKARRGLVKKNYMDEDDVYAGSAFFVSPSPSSLPLPSFTTTTTTTNNEDNFHVSATRDLRRLLRLE